MKCLVSITDREWIENVTRLAAATSGRLDEVNFWRPKNQNAVKAIAPGAPFFFRIAHGTNAIAGWGFFAHWQRVPFAEAWRLFGPKNGAPTFEAFRGSIRRLRGSDPTAPGSKPLGCVILRDVTLLPPERWLPWGLEQGWKRNIVNDCGYDLLTGPGLLLRRLLSEEGASTPPDLAPGDFHILDVDDRRWREQVVAARDGQGTFRSRLLEAYGSRCALTGDRIVPVLEAAHIQSYLGPASNHIQNGLLLRADLHNLYDAGYVTVTPDYRFRVSERVQQEFANGREYYEMESAGACIRPPTDKRNWPSREALNWHCAERFR